jgi:glycosyltransferase involved in cell wall biosynthesis
MRPASRGGVRGSSSCKGVPEIIQAGESLDERLVVDVYGPLGFGIRESAFSGRVRYRGVVDRDDVPAILSTYHALVLPSYYEGEGYPGVVIEAFAAGIPVVCTRWRALPELVDESCGILVAPRDAEELRDAMNALGRDSELYARLKAGVRRRREEFSDEVWHQRYVQYCLELASVGAGRGRRTRP